MQCRDHLIVFLYQAPIVRVEMPTFKIYSHYMVSFAKSSDSLNGNSFPEDLNTYVHSFWNKLHMSNVSRLWMMSSPDRVRALSHQWAHIHWVSSTPFVLIWRKLPVNNEADVATLRLSYFWRWMVQPVSGTCALTLPGLWSVFPRWTRLNYHRCNWDWFLSWLDVDVIFTSWHNPRIVGKVETWDAETGRCNGGRLVWLFLLSVHWNCCWLEVIMGHRIAWDVLTEQLL